MRYCLFITLNIFFIYSAKSFSVCDDFFVYHSDKTEKRFIHPKSKFIGFHAGFGFTSTIVSDPNNFLRNGYVYGNNTYVFGLNYLHGLGKNTSMELSCNFLNMGYRIGPYYDKLVSVYRGMYRSSDLQIGAMYRVIANNNLNIINIHAGLFFGVLRQRRHAIGSYENGDLIGTYSPSNEQNIVARIYLNNYNNFNFGIYLGASKDIRLSKDVRFFVSYQHRFGVNKLVNATINFETDANPTSIEGSVLVRGGGAFISGGFRILLFGKYLN